jgi:NADH-quinone oxidoreductase subunit G
MKVFTRSQKAIAAQKATMEFLLINHPLDCPICDQGGECELQDLAMGFGRDVARLCRAQARREGQEHRSAHLDRHDPLHPLHALRALWQEIAGIQELGTVGRGEHTRSAPSSSRPWITSCRATSSICARSAR